MSKKSATSFPDPIRTTVIIASTLLLFGAGCNMPTTSSGSGEIDRVTETVASERIDLSGMDLETLPGDIFSHTNVVELDISDNRLTGALPAEIRRLKKLTSLDASGNAMTGVPAEIGQLLELERLDLSDNHLTGLPQELVDLTKLKILDLRGNDISATDLKFIKAGLRRTKIFVD